jgi:catechol 2,3-dioxygenase-like lactoylglutathione lyase family enzyme
VLDHVRVMVPDVQRSRSFYERVLATLDYRIWHEPAPGLVGFGPGAATEEPRATVWLREGAGESGGTLISFTVASRELVEAFHREALAAGGTDAGAPDLRSQFHPDYYSAYVLDPNGVTLEVVCHRAA